MRLLQEYGLCPPVRTPEASDFGAPQLPPSAGGKASGWCGVHSANGWARKAERKKPSEVSSAPVQELGQKE